MMIMAVSIKPTHS